MIIYRYAQSETQLNMLNILFLTVSKLVLYPTLHMDYNPWSGWAPQFFGAAVHLVLEEMGMK